MIQKISSKSTSTFKSRIPRPYLITLAVIIFWDSLILLTPFMDQPEPGLMLYSFFGYFCHQLPSRSVSPYDVSLGMIDNHNAFPVCARDFAFYLSLLAGSILYPLTNDPCSKKIPRLLWIILAAVPMAIDGGTQILGWRESTNPLRFLTGGMLGFACAYYLIPLVNIFIEKQTTCRRILDENHKKYEGDRRLKKERVAGRDSRNQEKQKTK
ncbi:MAG: DUF2085 domain-containing protein [Candidatus Micrarchaeia archaeon]